jgi:hypothetical protein
MAFDGHEAFKLAESGNPEEARLAWQSSSLMSHCRLKS